MAGVIRHDIKGLRIELRESVTSTNTILRERAEEYIDGDHVLAAYEQSAGRGRMGRSFFSPHSGIYISFLLHPGMQAHESLYLTTAMAVAVSAAIDEVCGVRTGIKWVNDVCLGDKKICGILTEGKLDDEGGLSYAIIGIGINVELPEGGFPEEIGELAGALYDCKAAPEGVKERIIEGMIKHFYRFYDNVSGMLDRSFIGEYRRKSIVIGKRILVSEDYFSSGKGREATALFIDDECRLGVRFSDGEEKILSSGEVSTRLVKCV